MSGKDELIDLLKSGLIVSCQASPSPSLESPDVMASIAEAVVAGGAVAIRADGPENVRAIRERTKVPVIGIWKRELPDTEIYITPRLEDLFAVAAAGAQVVALDATARPRPGDENLHEIVNAARASSPVLLMADVSNFEEGVRAAELGFDIVGTTLSGYVGESIVENDGPDLDLVEQLANHFGDTVPVIAEGRIASPEQAVEALLRGAHAVVVGTAITRPQTLTQAFCEALPS
ncbi:MAG: N-acetylmannosamine-6-phosphate 2-epimerase [Opitutae bacterium]|nr:N-acetylmannosamine-6-phosphate 2-epimerase [Opitutae bacterium]|tara:strand:+ start:1767 stop:2465 length:699 start_codon:yes stop_codon:yes gene_type:complete